MSLEARGWRALPPPWLVGFVLMLAALIISCCEAVFNDRWRAPQQSITPLLSVVATWLVAYGTSRLARHATGRARTGLWLAAIAFYLNAGTELAWMSESPLLRSRAWFALVLVLSWSGIVLRLVATIGMCLAAPRTHRREVIEAIAYTVLGETCDWWLNLVRPGFAYGSAIGWLVPMAIAILCWVALYRLAIAIAEPQPCAAEPAWVALRLRGLARASVPICALVLLALFFGASPSLANQQRVLLALLLALACLAVGRVVVRAGRTGEGALSPYALACAGAMAWWCGATLIVVAARLSIARNSYAALDVPAALNIPLLAIVAMLVLVLAIRGFAAREAHDALLRRSMITIVCLVIALGIELRALSGLHTGYVSPSFIIAVLIVAAAALETRATVLVAARELEHRERLPAARVVG